MPIENAQYITQLVPQQPQGGESISEGDDHLRTIKTAVKQSFPKVDAPVTMTPAELNSIPTMTSDIADLRTDVTNLQQEVPETAYNGNVASCYYNVAFLDAGIQGGIVYQHNVQSVAAGSGGSATLVTFTKELDDWTDDLSAHYAFAITPITTTGKPIIVSVSAPTGKSLSFFAWELEPDGTQTLIPGGRVSFSMSITDMYAGQPS